MRRIIFLSATLALLATPALAGTVHVGVNGLVCAFCVSGIEAVFGEEPGVEKTQVDLDKKLVTLTTKGDGVSDTRIRELIEDAGYNVTTIHRQD